MFPFSIPRTPPPPPLALHRRALYVSEYFPAVVVVSRSPPPPPPLATAPPRSRIFAAAAVPPAPPSKPTFTMPQYALAVALGGHHDTRTSSLPPAGTETRSGSIKNPSSRGIPTNDASARDGVSFDIL